MAARTARSTLHSSVGARSLAATGGAGGAAGGVSEDELTELRKRFALLEGDRNAFYETSQWTIKQNKETVETLRQQNKELKQILQSQIQSRSQSGDRLGLELERGSQLVSGLRKQCDVSRHENERKEAALRKLQDQLADVVKQQPTEDVGDPTLKTIRDLENKLDKAMIKFNEAQSIKKTYEQIVHKLREERVGYDMKVAALEEALGAKQRDYEELLMMSHDAQHARTLAEADLAELSAVVENTHREQQKALQERQALLAQQAEQARLEEEALSAEDAAASKEAERGLAAAAPSSVIDGEAEQQQRRIASYEEAFRKIKEATGVADVNEVIQKFLSQEDTFKDLLNLQQVAQERIDALQEEKKQLKARMEELKYSGAGGNAGSRRLVDDFEQHVADSQSKCERARVKFERMDKILVNSKAGIEHLSELLEVLLPEEAPIPMSDETVLEVLMQADRKLHHVLAALGSDATGAGAAHGGAGDEESTHLGVNTSTALNTSGLNRTGRSAVVNASDLPETNVRIRLPGGDGDATADDDEGDEDDDEGDDGVPLGRDEVKRRSDAVVERLKKKKGKKKQA